MTGEAAAVATTSTKDTEMMETQVEKMVNETLEELNSNTSIGLSLSISPTWVPVSVSFYISPPKMKCFMYSHAHSTVSSGREDLCITLFMHDDDAHFALCQWERQFWIDFEMFTTLNMVGLVLRRPFFNSCFVWYFRLFHLCIHFVLLQMMRSSAQLGSSTFAKCRVAVNVRWYLNPCKPKIRYTSSISRQIDRNKRPNILLQNSSEWNTIKGIERQTKRTHKWWKTEKARCKVYGRREFKTSVGFV